MRIVIELNQWKLIFLLHFFSFSSSDRQIPVLRSPPTGLQGKAMQCQ